MSPNLRFVLIVLAVVGLILWALHSRIEQFEAPVRLEETRDRPRVWFGHKSGCYFSQKQRDLGLATQEWSRSFRPGMYEDINDLTRDDLKSSGRGNKVITNITTISVEKGLTLYLFTEKSFKGEHWEIVGSEKSTFCTNAMTEGWEDFYIRSFIIVPTEGKCDVNQCMGKCRTDGKYVKSPWCYLQGDEPDGHLYTERKTLESSPDATVGDRFRYHPCRFENDINRVKEYTPDTTFWTKNFSDL